jgi:phosphatidylglycerol:prolipoprotein diacylglycerol transferase
LFIDRYGIGYGTTYIIRFYGLIIMLGVLAAVLLSRRQAKRWGEDPERVWDLLIWLLIFGVIGARLWHIFTPSPSLVERGIDTWYYLTHPLDAIDTRKGGLGIPGAVIGGALALYVYSRRHHLSFARWTDIIAPGLVLAQAIGRWGNFFNQELYGAPTNLPWAVYIEPAFRLPGFENFSYFHPLFLYESIWNLINMGILLWISDRFRPKLKPGDVFLVYLILYPITRFTLEFWRLDSSLVAGVNANQWFMVIVGVIAVALLVIRHRKGQAQDDLQVQEDISRLE